VLQSRNPGEGGHKLVRRIRLLCLLTALAGTTLLVSPADANVSTSAVGCPSAHFIVCGSGQQRTLHISHTITAVRLPKTSATSAAAATNDVSCRYTTASYVDGGSATQTSLYGVDDRLGDNVYSNISQFLPITKTGFAWANVGVEIYLYGFPSGSSLTFKYPWHASGHLYADADYGAHGDVNINVIATGWDKEAGVKNLNKVYSNSLAADGIYPTGSSKDRAIGVDYNSTTNGVEMGTIHNQHHYVSYLHARTNTDVNGPASGMGSGHAEGNFFSTNYTYRAWVDNFRWIFHLPSGWSIGC